MRGKKRLIIPWGGRPPLMSSIPGQTTPAAQGAAKLKLILGSKEIGKAESSTASGSSERNTTTHPGARPDRDLTQVGQAITPSGHKKNAFKFNPSRPLVQDIGLTWPRNRPNNQTTTSCLKHVQKTGSDEGLRQKEGCVSLGPGLAGQRIR